MTTISTETSIHNVKRITAGNSFMPQSIRLTLESHIGLPSYVSIFLGDAEYVRRLVDAINAAAAPPLEDSDVEFAAAVKASIDYYNRYARDERR